MATLTHDEFEVLWKRFVHDTYTWNPSFQEDTSMSWRTHVLSQMPFFPVEMLDRILWEGQEEGWSEQVLDAAEREIIDRVLLK